MTYVIFIISNKGYNFYLEVIIIFKMTAFLNGLLIGFMIFINGVLSEKTGLISSTLIIHIIGFTSISCVLIIKKAKLTFFKNFKFYFFLPGLLGVFVVLLQNHSFEIMGASLTISGALFGQIIFSSVIDHLGIFREKKYKFNSKKIPAYILMAIGIVFMAFN